MEKTLGNFKTVTIGYGASGDRWGLARKWK
jgi:hypothetical protein